MRPVVVVLLITLLCSSAPLAAPNANAVEGQVLGADGKPLAGALVVAVSPHAPLTAEASRPLGRANADSDGRFRIASLPAGVCNVGVSAPNFPAAFLVNTPIGGPPVTLQMRGESFTITGRVLDIEGRPLPRAEMRVVRRSNIPGEIVYFGVAPDGQYAITLPIGAYEVLPVASGFSGSSQRVGNPSPRTLDFRLERAWPKGPAPEDVLTWVRNNAIRLTTAEPRHGFDDLRPLARTVSKARIVALGEATHSGHEFFLLKHRMLEWLVAEQGFTAFAMEAPVGESFDVNEYVLTGRGDAKKALIGLSGWPWDTEEVLDLIEWMRQWNRDPHHRKVHFYGVDMQHPVRALKFALQYLLQVSPKGMIEAFPALEILRSPFDWPDARRLPVADKAALADAATKLLKIFDVSKDEFIRGTGADAWATARQHAQVVMQYAEALNHPTEGIRDRAMAENTLWALEREGRDGKVVVWAHNGHVQFEAEDEPKAMGAYLRTALGDKLLVFGLAFNGGDFRALNLTGGPLELKIFTFPPSPEGSMDDVLAKAAGSIAALDLRNLPASGSVHDWFSGWHEMRAIGSGYDPSGDTLTAYPAPRAYDALLFVERTTAARILPMGDRPAVPVSARPQNGDFEQVSKGLPFHWYVPPDIAAFGYAVKTPRAGCPGNTSCVRIERTAERAYGEGAGTIRQAIDATSFRGKRIALQAKLSVNVAKGTGEGRLWIRIYRADLRSPILVYDMMRGRPIKDHLWRTYQIVIDVPQNAGTIEYGVALVGDGRLGVDDVSLTLDQTPTGNTKL